MAVMSGQHRPVFVTVFPTTAEALSGRGSTQVALYWRVPHHHLNSYCY